MNENDTLDSFRTLLRSKVSAAEKATRILEMETVLPEGAIAVMDAFLPRVPRLVQVAIMDVYFEMTDDRYHEQDLIRILDRAARRGDRDEELYMAAREALARVQGEPMDAWRDRSVEIVGVRTVPKRGARRPRAAAEALIVPPETLTIIIHGTWAAKARWWRKGGKFYKYVGSPDGLMRSDLYAGDVPFEWSGRNDDGKRRAAAVTLSEWMGKFRNARIHVLAHSHGANVAMLATRQGARIDRLVMLSPPVRKDYLADWSRVKHAYNIQAAFDPVVAIAKGGRWFRRHGLRRVKERELKASGHAASHDPKVWRKENLASFVEAPWP